MGQSYQKKGSRSRRKSSNRRGKTVEFRCNDETAEIRMDLPVGDVLAGVQGALESIVGDVGLLVIQSLIEDEVSQRAGGRYVHDEGKAHRWGREEGYIVLAGRKVPVNRPRVRDRKGGEVPLTRYRLFQSDDRLEESMSRRILNRVSTRRYDQVVDDICDGYGIRKSSVSRHWKAASKKQLQALMERSLDDLDLRVLMIDGTSFHDHLLVTAIGIDSTGRKHVLGLWPGASENATIVGDLLDDLIRRGLSVDRRYLFVLDGSKALRKGVLSRFGNQAIIQRCILHKERNVLAHLPKSYHGTVRMRLRAAWNMSAYDLAKKALNQVLIYLHDLNPAAARSLEEAFEETLTLHRLGVTGALRKSLCSTNIIESLFSTYKDLCRNVKYWRNSEMAWRWGGAVLLEAEKKFRRVRGCKTMPQLLPHLGVSVDRKAIAG